MLLRIPTDGDVEPVVLNEQAMRFDHVVAVAAQGPSVQWIERVGSGGERSGRWQAIGDAGFAGVDWAIVPVERGGATSPDSAELDAPCSRPPRRPRHCPQDRPGGAGVDLTSPLRVLLRGLAFLGEVAARRVANDFKGRLAVGPAD